MRVIVYGAHGQLGVDLTRECRRRRHTVLALSHAQSDITDLKAVRTRVARHRPDWVINAAAYNKVDLAESEPELAMRVNAIAVRNLALACQDAGATLLHFSTDHVFAGDKGAPYVEDDPPCPQSVYGVSKLAGELFVRSCCSSYYVLRVAGVFGPPGRYTAHGNFLEFVLRKCAEGGELRIVDDHFATPTFGTALASRCLDILERSIATGVYHLGGGEVVSWYEFARMVATAAGLGTDRISATNRHEYKTTAARPVYSALSNRKVEGAGIAAMPSLTRVIEENLKLRKRERPRSIRVESQA